VCSKGSFFVAEKYNLRVLSAHTLFIRQFKTVIMNKKVFTLFMSVLLLGGQLEAQVNSKANDAMPPVLQRNSAAAIAEQVKAGRSAMAFIENKGQVKDQYGNRRTDIDFKVTDAGIGVFIGDGRIYYQWAAPAQASSKKEHVQSPAMVTYRMDVALIGANKQAKVIAEQPQASFEQYFQGKNSILSHTYKRVVYKEIYPNIDWVFYFNAKGRLEHDFIVHPGGKVSDIQMKYAGAADLKINGDGSLTATTPMGSVTEAAPHTYVQGGGVVASSFVLDNGVLRFNTASYSGTLVIDPTLDWATYYGGDLSSGNPWTTAEVTKADNSGNVYIAGRTTCSNNIATAGSHQADIDGPTNIYLAKFSPAGGLLWATYYGSDGTSMVSDIACDVSGNVYITGHTADALPGFTTAGSHQDAMAGGIADAFLIKFSGSGSRLWSTFYGGDGEDYGTKIGCDASGNVFLAGTTTSYSNSIPQAIATTGAHKTVYEGSTITNGAGDIFLAKFNSAGVRQWGTYFGGDNTELMRLNDGNSNHGGLACDPAGNVIICASTKSETGIAFGASHQATYGGGPLYGSGDAFVAKFDTDGTVVWSTYYGGASGDVASSLSSDLSGNVFLSGLTQSDNGISTTGAFKEVPGNYDLTYNTIPYIAKFNASGVRQWGTYYGEYSAASSLFIKLYSSAVDAAGNLFISGVTDSDSGFVTANGMQTTFTTAPAPFLAKINSSDGHPSWGTYYGLANWWGFTGVTCDPFGHIYMVMPGLTNGFATTGSFQDTYLANAMEMSMLVKIEDCDGVINNINLPAVIGDTILCPGSVAIYSVPDVAGSYTWTLPAGWSGSSTTDSITVTAGSSPGTITVAGNFTCGSSAAQSIDVDLFPVTVPVIEKTGMVLHTGSFADYQWYRNGLPVNGADDSSYTFSEAGAYTVTVTDTNGCTATSAAFDVTNLSVNDITGIGASVKVYPNPAQHTLIISAPVKVNISLSGIYGNGLIHKKNAKDIDISSLADGVYLLRITDSEGTLIKVEKIVKSGK
jgi:hypothetical protein